MTVKDAAQSTQEKIDELQAQYNKYFTYIGNEYNSKQIGYQYQAFTAYKPAKTVYIPGSGA